LFPQKEKKTYEPMRGSGRLQTEEEQEASRKKMEDEMTAAREKREAAPPSE
jgi:hypothetical protein